MIYADLPEMERIIASLLSIAAEADEVLSELQRVSAEIQNNIELETYPQHAAICEAVLQSVNSLNRGNDTLQTLKGILAYVVEGYEENEKKNIDALIRMTLFLSNIQTGLSESISPGQVVAFEQTSQMQDLERVWHLVSESAAETLVTNVAAVGKVINEEYDVKQVVDMQSH